MFAALVGRGLSLLLDPTIVFSFGSTGYRVHSLAFDPADLDVDLYGRRIIVTGANAGIGYAAALGLAALGAEIVLLCRNRERGAEAAARIQAATGKRRVRVEVADMADLNSIRVAAERLVASDVDVLIHNAGLLPATRIETPQKLELTLATHVVGPHLLTRLLLPALERSKDARVIWVSSGGMYTQRLNLADPCWEERPYDGVVAYAETKRAQVVLAELWSERLARRKVSVNAMHPGWADTAGVRDSIPTFYKVARSVLRTPAEGADTIVWLAAAAAAREHTGQFFLDRTPRRTHYVPLTWESKEDRLKLWRLCERYAKRT